MSSHQRRDFRRMLYRLDLATSYPSIPALIQHFMDETTLDGVVEVKMVASPPMSVPPTAKGKRSAKAPPPPPAPLQPTTSIISFRREGRDVNAIALFGPASAPSSMLATEEGGGSHRSIEAFVQDMSEMVVKKRYPPRTTLVWVFAPLVQKLLDEGADTVVFEVRSYVAGADSAREAKSTLSPVSPYGTSHSTTEASPSVIASGSTPSSGGQGPGLEDLQTTQYAQSPAGVAYPHTDNKAPILTELHRRPQALRAEATSYEAQRSPHYPPVQRHSSMPIHPSGHTAPHWSYPQPGAWSTESGYSDLQPLPPAPVWESSLSSEDWDEQSHSTWQPDSGSGTYGYPMIPPLPWQSLQDPSYTSGALDPATGQMYFDTMSSPSFSEGFYIPNAGLGDRSNLPSDVAGGMTARSGGASMPAYASPGLQGDNRAMSWQTQYPYLGALGVPSGEAFPYSSTPRDQSAAEAAASGFDQRTSTGSPASPPDSSERDSLTPTLTNPGYNQAPTSTPRKQWPFTRGPANQPTQRVVSAYTPASPSLGTPGPASFRSFSAMLPRSRVRLRSSSPEPTREASIRGAKRLKVNPMLPSGSHLHPPAIASPPPLSAGSSSSAPRSTKSRVSSTVRSGSAAHRSHATVSPADRATQDQAESDSTLLEVLTRPARYKRMLGYAARQHDGSTVAYELSDSVAATTGNDTLLGLGLSGVTNVAALGMELGRRAARRQQELVSQGAAEPALIATPNAYGEHGIPQQPRGGDGRTGHIRGATSKPEWKGCVIA